MSIESSRAPVRDPAVSAVVSDPSAPVRGLPREHDGAVSASKGRRANAIDAVIQTILRAVFLRLGTSGYRLRAEFSNGNDWTNCADGEAELTIRFKTRRAELRTLFYFYEGFFEKYIDQEIDFIGEHPVALICRMGQAADLSPDQQRRKPRVYPRNPYMLARKLLQERLQSNKSKAIAKQNADFHYAIHPKLFEEVLGETVGYSEGYWVDGAQNLNQAKHNNCGYICRKLDLRPGDRVLEVGSGWGFMPIYMVKNYAVTVTVYNPVK